MNAHVRTIVIECTEGSDVGTLTFPQVIGKLTEAGVERYHADLSRLTRTYYTPDGESHVVDTQDHKETPAKDFDASGVVAALREIQTQKIDYRTFCDKILVSGCVGYIVSIVGRRAIYLGRTGDSYVETFPGAK